MSVNSHIIRQLNTAAAAAPEALNFHALSNAINGMTVSMHAYTQHQEIVSRQLQLIANQTPNAILQDLAKTVQKLEKTVQDGFAAMDDRITRLDAKYVALASPYC
jgi:hypothetical protein